MKRSIGKKSWNGNLQGCTGGDCTQNCCAGNKELYVSDHSIPLKVILDESSIVNGKAFPYTVTGKKVEYATMVNQDELSEILSSPNSEGITSQLNIGVVRVDRETAEPIVRKLLTINNCLGENGCKIENNKPSVCKRYPFTSYAWYPLDTRCPSAADIGGAEDNVIQILRIRKQIYGAKDNALYVENLLRLLDETYHITPNWKFMSDGAMRKALGIDTATTVFSKIVSNFLT